MSINIVLNKAIKKTILSDGKEYGYWYIKEFLYLLTLFRII